MTINFNLAKIPFFSGWVAENIAPVMEDEQEDELSNFCTSPASLDKKDNSEDNSQAQLNLVAMDAMSDLF